MLRHRRFKSYQPQPGRSIIGNVFDLGSKDCRFKSYRPDILTESHNGSAGACKALGKGSIPFSGLGWVAERLIAWF